MSAGTLVLVVLAVIAVGGRAPAAQAAAFAQAASRTYFWGSVSATISGPGQPPLVPVVRPSRIFLTNDGAAVLINVRWTNWGGSTATATATDSASNGIPNIAQGKRTNTPATVKLSNLGVFQNRRVYRCFAMTIPSKHSTFRSCLKNTNGYWFFG